MAISAALGSAALLPAGLGFRNVIINGDFDVWQRGTDLTTVGADTYNGPDRWRSRTAAGAGSLRMSRVLSGLAGTTYCARMQRTAGNTNTSPLQIVQTLESITSIPLAGQVVTFSFWARKGADYSPTTSLLNAAVVTGTGTDQYWLSFTNGAAIINENVVLTTTWQRFVFSAVPAANISQFYVKFEMNPTGTAGTNDYCEITGVQLEQNAQATPFEQRPIGVETALCQRYYWRSTAGLTTDGSSRHAHFRRMNQYASVASGHCAFPVPMRVEPTVGLYNGNGLGAVDAYGVGQESYVVATGEGLSIFGIGLFVKYTNSSLTTTANFNVDATSVTYWANIEASAEL